MNPTATATGLVRPSYSPPGQAEYVNVAKLELDLEDADWQIQALRLRLGTLKTERDRALKQMAARDQTIASLRNTITELKRPARDKGQLHSIGRLSLNLPLRELRLGDRVVPLSKSEVEVMAQLFVRPDVMISTLELASGMTSPSSRNSLRAFLWRVRGKLDAAGMHGYLHVRRAAGGGGHWMTDPESPAPRRPHRRKPDGPHPFAQPTIDGFDPARFRAARLAAGISLTDLAAASGVSRRTLGDWEHERQVPSQRLYERVVSTLWGGLVSDGNTYLYIRERALSIVTQALELADVAERAGDPISGHNLREMAERGRQVVKSATLRMMATASGEGQSNG